MRTEEWSYRDFAAMSESRWNVEKDIDWHAIDVGAAKQRPDHLDLLRRATLIESYHPMSTRAVIGLYMEDVDATSVLTIEMFEGFRHFWALRRYLEACDVTIPDEELARLRADNPDKVDYRREDRVQVLLNFAWSEHFAGFFFRRIGEETADPVLRKLMKVCAQDEFRHCAGALKVLARHARLDPEVRRQALVAMHRFRHYGDDIGPVPVSQGNDVEAVGRIVRTTLDALGADWQTYAAARPADGDA
jgi:hypothetical protein